MSVTIGQSGGREKDTNTLILQRETNNQLVAWNVGVFTELLKNVVAARTPTTSNYLSDSNNNVGDQMINCHPIDEISATIAVPNVCKESHEQGTEMKNFKLQEEVVTQLNEFIMLISLLYRSNTFHNLEHASHVVMSTMKLPDRILFQQQVATKADVAQDYD
jgi:hypothetical protein